MALAVFFLVSLSSGCSRQSGDWGFSTCLIPERSKLTVPSTPQYDAEGNLIVPPEVRWTYSCPDFSAGTTYDFRFKQVRPVLEMELFEFKAPWIRTNAAGVMLGNNMVAVHLSHQWTSIFEIKTGVFFGYDTDEHKSTCGVNVLILKF